MYGTMYDRYKEIYGKFITYVGLAQACSIDTMDDVPS